MIVRIRDSRFYGQLIEQRNQIFVILFGSRENARRRKEGWKIKRGSYLVEGNETRVREIERVEDKKITREFQNGLIASFRFVALIYSLPLRGSAGPDIYTCPPPLVHDFLEATIWLHMHGLDTCHIIIRCRQNKCSKNYMLAYQITLLLHDQTRLVWKCL